MKWIVSILICLGALAQQNSMQDPQFLERLKGTPDPTYIFNEQFEAVGAGAAGCDVAGWILTGTTAPDPNDVSTPSPLKGFQSLLLIDTGTDAQITNTFTATGEIWVRWDVNPEQIYSGGRDGISIWDNAGNKLLWTRFEGDGTGNRFDMQPLGATAQNGTFGDIATNTTYHCKMYLKKGSGANAISALWWTNTLPFATVSNFTNGLGTWTTDASGIQIHEETKRSRWDDVRIRTIDITD